jgi:glutamate 5-kinase
MATKLRAAAMVTAEGADLVIANGAKPELLYEIVEGQPVGTRFARQTHAKTPAEKEVPV